MNGSMRPVLFWCSLVLIATAPAARGDQFYQQTDLVTSATDSDLINPWGVSSSASSPFWVSDNGTGRATLYNSGGSSSV